MVCPKFVGAGLALRSANRSGSGLVLSGVSDSGALDSSLLVGFRAVEIFFHEAPGSQGENSHDLGQGSHFSA
jgi:hypothetical protein